jgi:hypothetical protein
MRKAAGKHQLKPKEECGAMTILFVRFATGLAETTLAGRVRDHLASCRDVPGLVDVTVGRESVSGDVCGIYTFTDEAALQGFQRSQAAWLLPSALEVSEVRMEVIEDWPTVQPAPPDRQVRPMVDDESLVGRIAEALVTGWVADAQELVSIIEPYLTDRDRQRPAGQDAPGRSARRVDALRMASARVPADRRRLKRAIDGVQVHRSRTGGGHSG